MNFPESNCGPAEMRGLAGVPGWDYITPAEIYLTEVCSARGFAWRYVHKGYERDPNPGAERKSVMADVRVHVGVMVRGEGRTLAARYRDVALYLVNDHNLSSAVEEPESSNMLGSGLYELDLVCSDNGWTWSLPGSWHYSADRQLDGSVLIGSVVGFCARTEEEALMGIAEYVAASHE